MFDKVLSELKKPSFNMDVNGLDISSGMTIMHYACAGGSVVRYYLLKLVCNDLCRNWLLSYYLVEQI